MIEDVKTFTFTYEGPDNSDIADDFPVRESITKTFEVDANATWDVVMKQFVLFLGHCWGYDISDKVEYSTLQDKLQKLRDDGILWDDGEDWDLTKG